MKAFTYVLIFAVIGLLESHGNAENSKDLLELLSEIGKSNASIGQFYSGSNQTINITIINNYFFNSTGPERPVINKKGEIIKKLEDECVKNSECNSIPYAVCSSAKCSCSENYIPKNGTCVGLPDESYYETPVASARACEFLEDALYKGEKCYKKKKLHKSCSVDEQCPASFSECSNGECKCKDNHWEHDNRCYARYRENCNTSEDCPTIWMDCISGTCQVVHSWHDGALSSKPGATAVWNRDKYYNFLWFFSSHFNASTSKEVGDPGNLAWKKNYSLDRIVALHLWSPLSIYCRAKNPAGDFVPGKVEFYENNKLCQVHHKGQKFSTQDYEVYVDLGPEN